MARFGRGPGGGPGGPGRGPGGGGRSGPGGMRPMGRGPMGPGHAGPGPMAPRPPMRRPVMMPRPMAPVGRYRYGGPRPIFSPFVRRPIIVPIPYYPPVVPVRVPIQPLPYVPTGESLDFAQVLGQLNYLMQSARQDTTVDNQDIVALSSAIDRAQAGDADGLITALRGMSAQLVEQARQMGMAYLVQLSMA